MSAPSISTPAPLFRWTRSFLRAGKGESGPGLARPGVAERDAPARVGGDRSGTVLAGQWELLRRLGRGGMGEVYEAFCRGDRRRYAVKVLAQEHAGDPTSVERFKHEFWALRQMAVPGLVEAHALYCDGGVHFYSMELLEGIDLAALGRVRRPSPIEVAEMGLQLCETLGMIHEKGVIHRDVKPGNIICLRSGGVKLVDLGIGKLLPAFYASSESRTPPEQRLQTSPGIKLGTPGFIAPEAGLGDPPTRLQDVFSLGVTLFRLATGRMPFPEGRPVAFGDEPRSASSMGVELPAMLEMTLRRSMITNPSHRIPSMGEFWQELDDARADILAMETSDQVAGEPRSAHSDPGAPAGPAGSAGPEAVDGKSWAGSQPSAHSDPGAPAGSAGSAGPEAFDGKPWTGSQPSAHSDPGAPAGSAGSAGPEAVDGKSWAGSQPSAHSDSGAPVGSARSAASQLSARSDPGLSASAARNTASVAVVGRFWTGSQLALVISAAVAFGIIIGIGVPVALSVDSLFEGQGQMSAVPLAEGLRRHVEQARPGALGLAEGPVEAGEQSSPSSSSSSSSLSGTSPSGSSEGAGSPGEGSEHSDRGDVRPVGLEGTPSASESTPEVTSPEQASPRRARSTSPRTSASAAAKRWARDHDPAIQRCIGALDAQGSVDVVLSVETSGRVTDLTVPPGTPSLIRRCLRDVFSGLDLGERGRSRQLGVSLHRKASMG